jgi:23S rRNA pseudouridine2604 synthase
MKPKQNRTDARTIESINELMTKTPRIPPRESREDESTPAAEREPRDDATAQEGLPARDKLRLKRPAIVDSTATVPGKTAPRPGVRARFKADGLKPKRKPDARKPGGSDSDASESSHAPAPPAWSAAGARERLLRKEGTRPAPSAPRHAREPERQRGVHVERRATAASTAARAAQPAPETSPEVVAGREGVRLSKIMAERGLCSRREADGFIERGWVFVDGQRVSELGIRINPAAEVWLAPEAAQRQNMQVTILLHKPVGYVSGQPEPGFEPAVALIGPDNQFDKDVAQRFHHTHLRGLAPAGRLDIDSTGLLVLTQNGRIARQLIGEDSKTEKEYIVRVSGGLDANGLALLNHGLVLDGRRLRHAKVEWLNDDQLRFVLREGRKRQIRRMCELVGLKVTGLKRVRIGQVTLSDLPLGQWRYLRADETF